jgi:hypothetical protein
MMGRKKFERRIMTGLVILLMVEITLLALHLTWGGFRPRHDNQLTALAGVVQSQEHELRRRSLNSLVWEKSTTHDPLYYYDSILTLSQSTASLKLFKNTDLHLSENTLVTIEPPSDDRHGEIRLLFHKGGFKARNPYVKTEVKGDNWSMEIKTDSEVDLRQASDENYELQVTKGEVDFKSMQGEQHLSKDEVLRIDPQSLLQMQVLPEDTLRWVEPPAKRIYTHHGDVSTTLKWQGIHPKQLVRQTLGAKEEVWPLGDEATEITLALPVGHHSFFLRNETQTSQPLEIEVWNAPLIHLVSPLPRNRVKTDEPISFVWTTRPEVATYHFRLKGAFTSIDKTQSENALSLSFSAEDNATWSIEGIDNDGFVIPPPYSYPIFIREAPLAAPMLKHPVIRKPAKAPDGASFWYHLPSLLIPEAQAEEKDEYQAVFSWDPVEHADRYVIEISETADFRNPIINEEVSKSEFTWRKVDLKTYYWRVAAQSKRGQMGFFSEPQRVNFRNLESENVVLTLIKKPKPKIEEAPPEAKPEQPPPPTAAPIVAAPPPEPPVDRYRLEWRPRYQSIEATASGDAKATIQGISAFDLGFHEDVHVSPSRILRADFEVANSHYQPSPPSNFPSQNDLQWLDIRATGVVHSEDKMWGYGVSARTTPLFARDTDTSITSKTGFMFGPTAENWQRWDKLEYYGDYTAFIGSGLGGAIQQNIRKTIWDNFAIGAGLEVDYLFNPGGSSTSLTGQVSLGFQF